MKVKDLIKELQAINPEKRIALVANLGGNPEDDEADSPCYLLEAWDDGEESITLFMADKRRA
jgi:hypothetical protein